MRVIYVYIYIYIWYSISLVRIPNIWKTIQRLGSSFSLSLSHTCLWWPSFTNFDYQDIREKITFRQVNMSLMAYLTANEIVWARLWNICYLCWLCLLQLLQPLVKPNPYWSGINTVIPRGSRLDQGIYCRSFQPVALGRIYSGTIYSVILAKRPMNVNNALWYIRVHAGIRLIWPKLGYCKFIVDVNSLIYLNCTMQVFRCSYFLHRRPTFMLEVSLFNWKPLTHSLQRTMHPNRSLYIYLHPSFV